MKQTFAFLVVSAAIFCPGQAYCDEPTSPTATIITESTAANATVGVVGQASGAKGLEANGVVDTGVSFTTTTRSANFLPALNGATDNTMQVHAVVGSSNTGETALPALRVDLEHGGSMGVSSINQPQQSYFEFRPIDIFFGAGFDRNIELDRNWAASVWVGGKASGGNGADKGMIGIFGEAGIGMSGMKLLPFLMIGVKASREGCMYLDEKLRHALCVAVGGNVKAGALQAETEAFGKFYYKYALTDDAPAKHVFNSLTVGPQLTVMGRADLAGLHGDAQAMFGIAAH